MENLVQNLSSVAEYVSAFVCVVVFVFAGCMIWYSTYIKTRELWIVLVVSCLLLLGLFVFRASMEEPNANFWAAVATSSLALVGTILICRRVNAVNKEQKEVEKQPTIRTSLTNGSE